MIEEEIRAMFEDMIRTRLPECHWRGHCPSSR